MVYVNIICMYLAAEVGFCLGVVWILECVVVFYEYSLTLMMIVDIAVMLAYALTFLAAVPAVITQSDGFSKDVSNCPGDV